MDDSRKNLDNITIESNIDTIVNSISIILTEIINDNTSNEKKELIEQQCNLPFFSKKIPNISIKTYLDRILKYTKMEDSSLVLVLLYIDKLCETNNFILTCNNIHR